MHGTSYIRDEVPCGLGHRLIVSRGRGNIYEFNGGMMIDWYSHTVGTDILRTQRWGEIPQLHKSFSISLFSPLKSCTLRWRGDTPAAPNSYWLNLAYLGEGEIPQLHPLHTLNLSYLDEGEIPRLHPLHTHWRLHTVIHLFLPYIS